MTKLFFLLLFLAVSWIIQRAKRKSEEASAARPLTKAGPAQSSDEQVRRIQEEIRRKILERAAGGSVQSPPQAAKPEPTSMPRPAENQPVRSQQPVVRRVPLPHVAPAEFAEKAAAEKALAEQAQSLELGRREARRAARALLEGQVPAAKGGGGPTIDEVRHLRDPASIRRAIILREVLGPPLSLR